MWIIPSNLPLSSASALEYLESSEDLKELASIPVSWPTWKSKPTSLQTWLRAWKRVYWIQHLFGRMLKPSMHVRFVEEYTQSLAVIHAQENPLPGYGKATFIKDSFGRLYAELSRQPDLFSGSSKTWTTILRARIRLYNAAYKIWVIGLRAEYTQRKKLALLRKGSDCSSLRWPTATAMDTEQEPDKLLARAARMKARNNGKNGTTYSGNGCGMSLGTAVKKWATASARGWKSGNSNQHGKNERPLSEQVLIYGQPDKASINTTGKNRAQLNPAWVAQLMGTTLGKIFFVPLVTQSWSKQQN
jgi:hypothetical protein